MDKSKIQKWLIAPKKTTLWLVPGAEHVGSYQVQPQEYLQRVLEIFKILDDTRRAS